ncbi:hypothetical protein KUCAC02_014691 [Chaenocephalus aceratus]|uniref:Uncharacterized protein n=1 Tax=Chaenocephalus aceratus TaxID=36190 RepID=A0ACB9WF74_CHAAC|nr:hypothetical protein KUCAC02_014691 [Chaenocephalus aceratus]
MGRKLDPTTHVKKGPGRKSRKQKGAEIELPRKQQRNVCQAEAGRAAKRVLSKKATKDAAKEKPKKGFTDENSEWLTPAKRKRKLEEAESGDDSDEHWENEEDLEMEDEEEDQTKKGVKEQGKKKKTAKAEIKEGEEKEDDDDEEMVDDYGAPDGSEAESDGELLPIDARSKESTTAEGSLGSG